ncbi:MAG TPA: hypothetical protein PLS23_17000, partial [Phycisphaerae bacterium]|nr:hypothetical protein [Phycisphaerae bacterium]
LLSLALIGLRGQLSLPSDILALLLGVVGVALVGGLLPALVAARRQAQASVCLSNQKQIGIGLCGYVLNNKDRYPEHSSLSSVVPRTRWPDYLHRYMRETKVYLCPGLTDRQKQDFKKPFAHTVDPTTGAVTPATRYHGGYGYNFQYLGNSRVKTGGQALPEWAQPFHASVSDIRVPGQTLAVADTRGSRQGDPNREPGQGSAAVYVIDPPLGSRDLGSRGSRSGNDPARDNMWYEGGTEPEEEENVRSRPDDRHIGKVNASFADGHAEAMALNVLDGRHRGGPGDNRYYNGLFDPDRR